MPNLPKTMKFFFNFESLELYPIFNLNLSKLSSLNPVKVRKRA